MKIVISGAGEVGSAIARYLSQEGADITVIDQRADLVRQLAETIDVTTVVGHASHPDVLERAGLRDADMLIAVTYADEVNMIACEIANALFKVPTKIARVRSQVYLDPSWSDLFTQRGIPIDVIISPEVEVARAIKRRIEVPGALDIIPLADDKVRLVGVRCSAQTPILSTPLRQLTSLFPEMKIVVVGIKRGDRVIVPKAEDEMFEGDDVYFVVASDQCQRALAAFGHEEPATRRSVILGGGNIGLFVARQLEREHPEIRVTMIENDRARAEFLSREFKNAVVINGDAMNPDILTEAGIHQAETAIAVTQHDEINVLSSLLAKRKGAQRVITLVNQSGYNTLMGDLEIDVVVNPRSITVSRILQHVRRGRIHSVHTVQENFGELIEADAMQTSPMVGKPLREVNLPTGCRFGAIIRDGKLITPRGETVVATGDRIVLFAAKDAVKKVEKLFSVRLEYF
ncbi:MAG: Trk system potassium transporter TrkA [Alphaproteobacteria bacterium]|nr:Trk system potassium transporter TrkA [Alphaproteobacteria bacterium]